MGHGEGEGDGCTMPSKCITRFCLHTHLKEVLQKIIKLWIVFIFILYLYESSVIVPQIHALSNATLSVSEIEYSLFIYFLLHSCSLLDFLCSIFSLVLCLKVGKSERPLIKCHQ